MPERHDDRLGGRSDAQEPPLRGQGPGSFPVRRYRDQDLGEDPARHFPDADPDAVRRMGGADTDTLQAAGHRGRGPRGYRRADERIREDVCDRLTDDPEVDASHIEVSVAQGEVTLKGTVETRRMRRLAEDVVERVPGVAHIANALRTKDRERPPIFEGATSTSALGGLDAGMGSAGVSGLSGSPTGFPTMGTTAGRSGAAPGVTSTTGMDYSMATGTGRTGGPSVGRDEDVKDRAQPPR